MTLPAQAVRIWKTAVYLAGGEFRQMFVISTPGREDVRLYDATAVLPQAQLIALDAGLPIHSEVIEFMGEIRDTARIAPDPLGGHLGRS